jgi:hypothetical protein
LSSTDFSAAAAASCAFCSLARRRAAERSSAVDHDPDF